MPGAVGFPASSKLLEKKWNDRQYDQHQQKVKGMKHGVDNKQPKKEPHMILRLKKVQREEERQAEIENNNKLLLQKMTTIMKHKGRVDNWNEYAYRSRNKPYRDRQLEKINQENRAIAKRLEKVKPLYNTREWEKDYRKHNYYLELWDGATKDYELTPRSHQGEDYEDDFEDDDDDDRSRLPKIDSRNTSRRDSTTKSSASQVTKLPKIQSKQKDSKVDADCKALFKACKQLSRPEGALLRCLIRADYGHRMAVKERFKEMYDLDLATELKNALGKGFGPLIDALLRDKDEGLADDIGNALQNNDAAAAMGILCMQDSKSLTDMNQAYEKKYDVSLEEDIRERILDEDCQQLLLAVLKGQRSSSTSIDEKKAKRDAQAIADAGAGRFTDPDGVFMKLIQAGNYAQLQATMKAYKQITGKDITESMKEDGNSKNFIKTIQKLGQVGGSSAAEYWADQIHAHLKPNDPELAKILVAHSADMAAIRKAYKKKYKQDLPEALQKKAGEEGRYLAELSSQGGPSGAASKDDQKAKGESGKKQAPTEKKQKAAPTKPKAKGKGTVKESKDFDAEDDVTKLHEAMKGFGTDEQPLIDILSSRSNAQRQTIKKKYKEKYDKDLVEELKSELSGDFEEVILALMMAPVEYDAYCLHDAMKGLGTNETTLIGIICARTAKEMTSIKSKYKEMYKKEVEEDIIDDTSGQFKDLLVQLIRGERDQSSSVDQSQAEQDAKALYNDGKVDLVDDTFRNIICKTNKAQLNKIFEEYQKLSGNPIEEAVKRAMTGDNEDAYLALVLAVRNLTEFFASRLHDSMAGTGTNDNQLIRIVVSRAESDLADIKLKYKEMYEKTLADDIDSDTSGDYKKMLLALVKDK